MSSLLDVYRWDTYGWISCSRISVQERGQYYQKDSHDELAHVDVLKLFDREGSGNRATNSTIVVKVTLAALSGQASLS
jgi:hypothetical protein